MPETAARRAIHPDTVVGPVHLTVRDLGSSVAFYEERVGLQAHSRDGGVARLGAGGAGLVVLEERPEATRPIGTTGLYHLAVLVPSRGWLARSLTHLHSTGTALTGAADHLVSESLYLDDPEGNGIEIYRDRPREEWPRDRSGYRLATLPLDVESLSSEVVPRGEPRTGLPPGTRIGHVHLHVRNLQESERFYVDVMGFDEMARLGRSALFISAGGYHHHIGLNTWKGVGAPAPPPGSLGLRHFVIQVPEAEEARRVVSRLRAAGIVIEESHHGWGFADPSGNGLLITPAHQG